MIIFHEPWPGIDIHGRQVTCNREIRVTEEDAIKIQRRARKQFYTKHYRAVASVPAQHLLDDYITVNWAQQIMEESDGRIEKTDEVGSAPAVEGSDQDAQAYHHDA